MLGATVQNLNLLGYLAHVILCTPVLFKPAIAKYTFS